MRLAPQLVVILIIGAAGLAAHADPAEVYREPAAPALQEQADREAAPDPDARDGFDLSLDVGAGVTQFLHADLGLLFSRRFTIGLGFGFLPLNAVLEQAIGADDIAAAEAAAGVDAFDEPDVTMFSFLAALRLYPLKKAFFMEAAFEAWRFQARLSGSYAPPGTSAPLDLTATATVWSTMLGAHLGWRFLGEHGFFFELLVGLGFVLPTRSSLELSGSVVDDAARSAQSAAVVARTREYLGDQLDGKAGGLLADRVVLPTGALRLGFAFDITGS